MPKWIQHMGVFAIWLETQSHNPVTNAYKGEDKLHNTRHIWYVA